MAISKIILNGVTQIDLTQDTVADASHIRNNYVGHLNDGTTATGTYSGESGSSEWTTLVDQNVTISSGSPNYFTISNYTTAIGDAEQYRVTWGDSSHVYISRISIVAQTYDGYFYGNSVVAGSSDDGSGLSVLFYRSNASTLVGVTTDTGTKYLKIEKNVRSLNFQAKTNISPSTSSQTIHPDSQYDALSSVQINAMPAMTLPTSASGSSSGTSKATIGRSTSNQYINIPTGYNDAAAYYTVSAVANGTEGTPSATKGTVSNHSVSVTPSVTNTAGYISGGTHSGTAVTVTASELASGNKAIVDNGTNIDVVGYSTVSVAVPFSSIYSGSGTPSSGTGVNGDVYVKLS